MTEAQVRELIKAAVDKCGGTRAAGRSWGVSIAYISDTLNGRRAPGPSILKHIGYERVVVVDYRPIHGSCAACGFPNESSGACSRSSCCNAE